MMWPIKRVRKSRQPVSETRRRRRLLFEALEQREVLSGIVDVFVAGGTITLVGDGSNNGVEMRSTGVPGEYKIDGVPDTLLRLNGAPPTLPSLTVNGISGDISVSLGTGNDAFSFLESAPGVMSTTPANLWIFNDDGSNVNTVSDVLVNGLLSVTKNVGSSGYSELHIVSSTIIGDTLINNIGAGVDTGDTWTVIDSSSLQGGTTGQALLLENPYGKDILDVRGNSQFGTGPFPVLPFPIVIINNGGGGSRTTFTGASAVAGPGTTTVYGDLQITNGTNVVGFFDVVTFNGSNVLGDVLLDNADGDTETIVTNSNLGSHLVPAVGGGLLGGPTVVRNMTGYDKFTMTDSTVPWGLLIDNDFGNGSSLWGSTTTITNSRIGTNPYCPALPTPGDALQILGDNARDVVNLNGTTLGGRLNLGSLFNGNNELNITNASSMSGIFLVTGTGNDKVLIDNSSILVDVFIFLSDGADRLEIRGVDPTTEWPSALLGTIFMNGGLGVDTTNLDAIAMGALSFELWIP